MKGLQLLVLLNMSVSCFHRTEVANTYSQPIMAYETKYIVTGTYGGAGVFISPLDGGYDTLRISPGDSINIFTFMTQKDTFSVRVNGPQFALRHRLFDRLIKLPTYTLPADELQVSGYFSHDSIHYRKTYYLDVDTDHPYWITYTHHGLSYECL